MYISIVVNTVVKPMLKGREFAHIFGDGDQFKLPLSLSEFEVLSELHLSKHSIK